MNESKVALTERLRREGNWSAASKFKDDALRDFRAKGMKRDEASEAAWEAMEQAYPPIAAVAATADMQAEVATDTRIHGLSEIPAGWPQLRANASLQAEISWLSANRLRVRDANGVDLSRALSPAPSYSADVAMEIGCCSRSVRRWADSGRMPKPIKLGSLIRWPRAVIERWITDGCPNVRNVSKGGRS